MYTQRQASQLRQEFWTVFGQYMMPLPNADGEKINWVNYKSGNRFIQVKMEADSKNAAFIIELNHTETETRQLHYQQFLLQKNLFEKATGKGWIWQPNYTNEYGKSLAVIRKELTGVNIFDKSGWPRLISFFKETITAFDAFWQMAKHGFI
ncbi:MAG: DUF4268 domain-containing protein [Bacteroidota bacterium]